MNIHYSILFTIELLHEYYSNGRTTDIVLVPTADTEALFRKMRIRWRQAGSRYLALIEAAEKTPGVYMPSINTPTQNFFRQAFGKTVLRFVVVQQNNLFANITNLLLQSGSRYIFSNRSANQLGGAFFLSAPVTTFATGREYLPGNLAMRASNGQVFEALTKHTSTSASQLNNKTLWQPKGLRFLGRPLKKFTVGESYQQGQWVTGTGNKVFEAVRNTTAAAASEINNTALWKERGEGERQYPTGNDLLAYSTGHFRFPLAVPASTVTINVFGFNYNEAAPAFDKPAAKTTVLEFTDLQTEVKVNLSSLPPGRYLLDVNGEKSEVYYDPALGSGNVLGMVEIYNHLPGDNDFSFLTATEEIRQRDYVLHFPARSVLWKFNRKDSRASAITDTGETGYAFTLQDNAFVSSRPILLSQDAVETLELSFTDTVSKLAPLPNPPAGRLGRIQKNDFSYLSAELFLNY